VRMKVSTVKTVHGHAANCCECSLCTDQWLKREEEIRLRERYLFFLFANFQYLGQNFTSIELRMTDEAQSQTRQFSSYIFKH
jgi:hypothetical protein